ncbi:MAG: 50S ribosomal protein L23 [Gammaproteobacteria bacterium]|nr:50S ribosomal protein L23 [Gammaproteobacteria bacterium]
MNQERLYKILLAPAVSEKSARVADENNQYVFKVAGDASKPEIRAAVEKMFSVEVAAVQVANVKSRTRMFRRKEGRRSGWKKAFVKLKPGFDIDFVGAE